MKKQPLRIDRRWSVAELAEMVQGRVVGQVDQKISGLALDSRDLQKGDVFFALRAARDGHDFISNACEQGAAAVVVERELQLGVPQIVVLDTRQAMFRLAREHRRAWGKTVVAVSGSNGKTTTKELTATLIAEERSVHRAPGTWNNELGVPLSLLMLEPEHEVCVLEFGISAESEMTTLCQLAEPDIGVLTSIGPTHLETLGSVAGVASAKGELFRYLHADQTIVVNVDDPHLLALSQAKEVRAKKITVSRVKKTDVYLMESRQPDGRRVELRLRYGKEPVTLQFPLLGDHNVSNLLCGLGVAKALGISSGSLVRGVRKVVAPDLRLDVIPCGDGVWVINDCYNANPSSMTAALAVGQSFVASRKVAILGDMMELGEGSARAHRDIGIAVAKHGFDRLIVLGRYAGDYMQGAIQGGLAEAAVSQMADREQGIADLVQSAKPGDLYLFKASRALKLEEISQAVVERLGQGERT